MNSLRGCFNRLDPVKPPVAAQPLDKALAKYSLPGGTPFSKASAAWP